MEKDEVLAAMRNIQEAQERKDSPMTNIAEKEVLVSISCDGLIVAGVLSQDMNEQLMGYAKTRKQTREEVFHLIYLHKGSISSGAVEDFLFGDPRK
jgi:orotate phosphoribosyltransferase-like protein